MKLENDLGRDGVGRLVWRIALPSMMAQFVNVLYNIVDRMYIGNIPGTGTIALAGAGICGPVVTMIGSVAFLVGVGGTPLMSIHMGEGKPEKASRILANAFVMLCVFGLLLMSVLYLVKVPMLKLFGASEATLPFADAYFSYYLSGTVFALLASGMNQFIICQGFAKVGMFSVMLGALLNIILDPVFIFVFDMGVRGAALATVLSQLASCLFVLRFLFSKKVPIPITFRGYHIRTMGRILLLGFTPFIIIAIDNVMIIAMNAVLQHYGGPGRGDLLITCATIVQSFMLIVTMPLGGITGGTQTILAYNYGAGSMDRVKRAQRCIFLFCVCFTAAMFLLARLGGPLFVSLFTRDAVLAEKAFWAIRVCTLSIIPLGLQYEVVDGFTAMGQVKYALPISFFRKLVYFLALFILPAVFGAESIFYSEPISDILGPIVSVCVYTAAIRNVLAEREKAVAG